MHRNGRVPFVNLFFWFNYCPFAYFFNEALEYLGASEAEKKKYNCSQIFASTFVYCELEIGYAAIISGWNTVELRHSCVVTNCRKNSVTFLTGVIYYELNCISIAYRYCLNTFSTVDFFFFFVTFMNKCVYLLHTIALQKWSFRCIVGGGFCSGFEARVRVPFCGRLIFINISA